MYREHNGLFTEQATISLCDHRHTLYQFLISVWYSKLACNWIINFLNTLLLQIKGIHRLRCTIEK